MLVYFYAGVLLYAIQQHPRHCAQHVVQSLRRWRIDHAARYTLLLLPILATALATTAEQALGLALILATTLHKRR